MEGVASEAASLAGHLKLGKLVCLYDDNSVTLSAGTDMTFSEDRGARFDAYGWQTISVGDGNDLSAIDAALAAARAETARPTLILVRTHLGFGSPEQDSFKAHGSPLGVADVAKTKDKLGWPQRAAPSSFPRRRCARFREALRARREGSKPSGTIGMRRLCTGVSRARPGVRAAPEGRAARRLGRRHPGLLRPMPRAWRPASPAAR